MIIVFTLWGDKLTRCAEIMVRSCRALGYEVVQLADEVAPEIDGVAKVLREPMNGRRAMVYRMDRLAGLDIPEYVSLDVDQVVMGDISDGFSREHDASLFWRPNKEDVKMIYNAGLIFVRNRDFVREVAALVRTMGPKEQDWFGDQLALQQVAEGGRYKIKELREARWNYKPAFKGERRNNILIYHCKGNRKDWMECYA